MAKKYRPSANLIGQGNKMWRSGL